MSFLNQRLEFGYTVLPFNMQTSDQHNAILLAKEYGVDADFSVSEDPHFNTKLVMSIINKLATNEFDDLFVLYNPNVSITVNEVIDLNNFPRFSVLVNSTYPDWLDESTVLAEVKKRGSKLLQRFFVDYKKVNV